MMSLIAAVSENGALGYQGKVPWKIRGEQAFFKQVTMGHPIVMGRRTWASIGRPLPGRPNYVLTRNPDFHAPGVEILHHPSEVMEMAKTDEVFVIGGAELYQTFLPVADKLILTTVHRHYEGDTFFPEFEEQEWKLVTSHEGPDVDIPHTFKTYVRKSSG